MFMLLWWCHFQQRASIGRTHIICCFTATFSLSWQLLSVFLDSYFQSFLTATFSLSWQLLLVFLDSYFQSFFEGRGQEKGTKGNLPSKNNIYKKLNFGQEKLQHFGSRNDCSSGFDCFVHLHILLNMSATISPHYNNNYITQADDWT